MSNNLDLRKIYDKIIDVYPFLNKTERSNFEKGAKNIIKITLLNKKNIKALLNLLGNPHAYMWVWKKPLPTKLKKKRKISYKIEDRILNLTIPSWSGKPGTIDKKLINICVRNEKKYDSVLIDVRNNSGGNSRIAHSFASIFFKSPCIYGKFVKRGEKEKLFYFMGELQPNDKFYINKPIVILISNKCFSSNELFLAPFKISGRAVLVGQITRGGSANPISETVEIGGEKIVVLIPTWRFFLKNMNKPIEKTKIKPDIFYNKKDIIKFTKTYIRNKIL
jgi:C-terminal processing protease CtpA/Prc